MKFNVERISIVEINLTTLSVVCKPRYWEDTKVNGVFDTDGTLIPLRFVDRWVFNIDLDTGIIKDWPKGTTAEVRYKVCDAGRYYLMNGDTCIYSLEYSYVPKMLCPEENGFGDYININIDGNGKIDNWKVDISEFIKRQG